MFLLRSPSVIIPESDPVFVIDLISKIHAFKRDSSLVVFCMDKINEKNFQQIPTYELNNLNVHFAIISVDITRRGPGDFGA